MARAPVTRDQRRLAHQDDSRSTMPPLAADALLVNVALPAVEVLLNCVEPPTAPPPRVLRGSTSSNFEKISDGARPMVLAITLRRPRCAMAMRDRATPAAEAVAKT